MSNQDDGYPKWFLWLWDRGFVVVSVLGLLVLSTMSLAVYINQRLEGIEEQFAAEPPRGYKAPDLDALAVAEPPSSFAVQKRVYVPAYSHLYYHGGRPFPLEATLSIRNTDLSRKVYVRSVGYHDTDGKLVRQPVNQLIALGPLGTLEFVIQASDSSGGSGANFIVEWLATESSINEPIIEAVMVGVAGTQGICLRAPGKTLVESKP